MEELTIHTDRVLVSSFMGFGVQLDPYEYRPSDGRWQEITRRLDELHPAFFRVMFNANAYCMKVDAQGCVRYVWQKNEQASDKYEQILRILDYAESRHVAVMIGEWAWPRLPHDAGVADIRGPDDLRWPEIVAPFLLHLQRDKHYTVLRFYNYMNEPNGGWMWPGGRAGVDYEAWKKGYIHARQVFDAAGLHIALVGPDNSGDWDWLDKAVRDTSTATGAWEMHWYPKDEEITSGVVYSLLRDKKAVVDRGDPAAASKPLYLGEAGIITGRINGDQQPRVRTFEYGVRMADFAAQVAQAGWMGASAWDLDDAMHTVKEDHPAIPNGMTLKTWGFWNSEGSYMGNAADAEIRPWFWLWRMLARFFPAGSRIVEVSDPTSSKGVRSIAAEVISASGGHSVNVLLVNDHDSESKCTIHLLPFSNQHWVLHRYAQNDAGKVEWNSGISLEPRRNAAEITLPASSVAVLASGPE